MKIHNLSTLQARKAAVKAEIAQEQFYFEHRLNWLKDHKTLLLWEWLRPKKGWFADFLQPIVPVFIATAGAGFWSKIGTTFYEQYLKPWLDKLFTTEQ